MNEQNEPNGQDPRRVLAAALGRVPSGIFVVTARQGEAETGMLASWVQQCSFDPPQLTVAIRRDRGVLDWLTPGAPLTVNILGEGQTALVSHFGKGFRLDEPAFVGLNALREPGQAPLLADALAGLACEVASRYSGGDHELFVVRVLSGRLNGEGRPMIHVRKNGLNY
jgi:flavin reductase (DIM6/NTAB) family NADH-FMN oxidoreductase RutF